MNNLRHYMIDIETTGTNSQNAAMIQLACVRFCPNSGEVDPNMFCRSLHMAPFRYWDESTRAWWNQRPALLKDIQSKAEDPALVMQAFQDWVLESNNSGECWFWAKPSTFDYNFVNSYFEQFNIFSPFDFRAVIDMRSWLRGKLDTLDVSAFENAVEFQGIEHDARFDALHQVRIVLKAAEQAKIAA